VREGEGAGGGGQGLARYARSIHQISNGYIAETVADNPINIVHFFALSVKTDLEALRGRITEIAFDKVWTA